MIPAIIVWCIVAVGSVFTVYKGLQSVPYIYYPKVKITKDGREAPKRCKGDYHRDEMRAGDRPVLGPQTKPVCHYDDDPRPPEQLPADLVCRKEPRP